MELLTFGQVILFEGNHYVWLAPDPENEEYHVAKILDKEKTKKLIATDKTTEKKINSPSYDSPIYAYVILSSQAFKDRAAHLFRSNEYVEKDMNFSVMGTLMDSDIKELKKRILAGTGLPPRLVNLIKKLS